MPESLPKTGKGGDQRLAWPKHLWLLPSAAIFHPTQSIATPAGWFAPPPVGLQRVRKPAAPLGCDVGGPRATRIIHQPLCCFQRCTKASVFLTVDGCFFMLCRDPNNRLQVAPCPGFGLDGFGLGIWVAVDLSPQKCDWDRARGTLTHACRHTKRVHAGANAQTCHQACPHRPTKLPAHPPSA